MDTTKNMLVQGAIEMGWNPPTEGSLDDVVAYLYGHVASIKGVQDREHAENGIRSAIDAARANDAAYVAAGLFEAKKVLELHHYDANPLKHEPHTSTVEAPRASDV